MNGDRSTIIAVAIGGLTVLGLGAVSLSSKDHRAGRFRYSFPIFRESGGDHGLDQARRELGLVYRSLMKFAERTRRLPAGDPLSPSSEFRRELRLSDDDVRVPVEWGMNIPYAQRYSELRCDGEPKPAFPPKGVRDVWMSGETGGPHSSVVLLWSDGKIEVRPGSKRMAVRPSGNIPSAGWFGMMLVYADETGVPLVYRTLAQREKTRASQPPFQFRAYPPGTGPMPMRFGPMSGAYRTPLTTM